MSDIFEKIEDNNIKEAIKNTFDMDLDISGGWGYDKESAVKIHSLNIKKEEFFQLFASIRANIELNILKHENERYGGINPTIKSIQNVDGYFRVCYEIQAMKKSVYNEIIKEYKQGYGKSDFDIQAHFDKRKSATQHFDFECWYLMDLAKFAKIRKLFLQDKQDGLISKNELFLDEKGVHEDKFYGKEINRSVLLTSTKSYEKTQNENIKLSYGQLGENILLDINPCELQEGQKLYINEVILQITQPCTMCKSLVHIDKRLPKLLKSDRGIFAKVVKNGKVSIGDEVLHGVS